MNFKKYKIYFVAAGILLAALLAFMLYRMFTVPNAGNGMAIVLMLLTGLVLGGVIVFLLSGKTKSEPVQVIESSHTVVESMRKVFKVVCAEGHFNEIYNYEENKKLFNIIPSKKKALVIVQAKVLVGYDFEKFKWEADELNHRIRLVEFPKPEVLSTETDYKYYNMEESVFDMFSKEDLAKIQQNGKQQVIEAARHSHLPDVAAEQMRTLLTELLTSKNWTLENSSVITDSSKMIGVS